MTSKFKKSCIAIAAGFGMIVAAAGGADAIVNGTETASGARPYQVSLQAGGEHYCGGSIIDATTIVTAAHCVEGESASTTTVRAGVTDATSNAGQDIGVASITSHPDYARNGLADIAVIKLSEPLTLGGNVQAIALATAEQLEGAGTGIVTGWGAVSENGDGSTQLLEASVPLVSDASCAVSLGTDARTETCAGGAGTDTCYGDSGGPLAIQTANGPALAGVTSWGEECGGDTPGAYADVPGLTDWIKAASNGEVAPDPESGPSNGGEVDEFDDLVELRDEEIAELFGDDETLEEGEAVYLEADEYAELFGDDAEYEDVDFEDADFDDVDFDDVDFEDVDFEDADFDDAEYEDADFEDAEDGDAHFEDEAIWFDVEVVETGEILSLYVDDDGSVWLFDE